MVSAPVLFMNGINFPQIRNCHVYNSCILIPDLRVLGSAWDPISLPYLSSIGLGSAHLLVGRSGTKEHPPSRGAAGLELRQQQQADDEGDCLKQVDDPHWCI